jgi:thioredoxin reductase
MNEPGQYDVVVVGGGAAGLNAALMLVLARRRVAVVDSAEPRNATAAHLHGFLSRDGAQPAELLAAGRAEVSRYGGEIIDGEVTAIKPGFVVRLATGQMLRARRVLVTTGLHDALPPIPGLAERWGIDILHCPYCHGWEVRDTPLGVLGSTFAEAAGMSTHQPLLVRQWSADVVFFPDGIALSDVERKNLLARQIRIVDGEVTGVTVRDDRLHGVALASGQVVERSALFIMPTMVPNQDLLTDLGCEAGENEWIVADSAGQTNVNGVWAAGNVTDMRAQLITAAAQGSAAGTSINADLIDEETREAVAALAAADRPSRG